MDDVLESALQNLLHDNYERSQCGARNRDADAELIRAALMRAQEQPTPVPVSNQRPTRWMYEDGSVGDIDCGPTAIPLYKAPVPTDPVIDAIVSELTKAISKFPTWPTDPLHASGVVMEEAGELAKAVLQAVYEPHKSTFDDVKTEAIQTAAMAIRFLRSMHLYTWAPGAQHKQDGDQ